MINNVVLTGRVVKDPELRFTADNTEVTNVVLAVSRGYKNSNDEYVTDFIRITLWKALATTVTSYCHKGDLIAVRGSIQSKIVEIQNDLKEIIKKTELEVVADKVTFLSSKKEEEINN